MKREDVLPRLTFLGACTWHRFVRAAFLSASFSNSLYILLTLPRTRLWTFVARAKFLA